MRHLADQARRSTLRRRLRGRRLRRAPCGARLGSGGAERSRGAGTLEALRLGRGAEGRRPRGGRGAARRPPRARTGPASRRSSRSSSGSCGRAAATAEVAGHRAGSRAARAALGYLAELFRFPGWYTADEVLELHQRLAGSHGGAAERRRLLELVALDDAIDRRVEGMSKGMQQRLGIAQALVGEPRLLLLDEPTSALDPVGRRIVRELLEELRGRGISVLLNSHLLSEVELVCDHVAILRGGELVAAGTPGELARPRGVELETDEGTRIVEGATREDAPRLVARGGRGRPRGLRRARAHLDARGGLPRGDRRRDGVSNLVVIAGYGFREAVRRKVFAVVLVLTVGFLFLFWLANHFVFGEPPRTSSRPRTCTSTRGRSRAPSSSGSRCSRRSSSASCSPSSSRSASCRGTPSAACCSRSSCGPSGARRCSSRASRARRPSA